MTLADPQRDVIVQHLRRRDDPDAPIAEQWLIFVGQEQRGQADDEGRAFVFARLLADLVKRPVWVRHGDGDFERAESRAVGGCSCC